MCGAYYGEVLRHHVDGARRWHAPDDEHALWRIEADFTTHAHTLDRDPGPDSDT